MLGRGLPTELQLMLTESPSIIVMFCWLISTGVLGASVCVGGERGGGGGRTGSDHCLSPE